MNTDQEPLNEDTAIPAPEPRDEGGPTYPQVQLLRDDNKGTTLLAPMGGVSFHRSIVLACLPGLMQEAFSAQHTTWDAAIEHAFTIADKVVARYNGK